MEECRRRVVQLPGPCSRHGWATTISLLPVDRKPVLDYNFCTQCVIQSCILHLSSIIRIILAHSPTATMCQSSVKHQLKSPRTQRGGTFGAVSEHREAALPRLCVSTVCDESLRVGSEVIASYDISLVEVLRATWPQSCARIPLARINLQTIHVGVPNISTFDICFEAGDDLLPNAIRNVNGPQAVLNLQDIRIAVQTKDLFKASLNKHVPHLRHYRAIHIRYSQGSARRSEIVGFSAVWLKDVIS
mmetsp:Transcript_45698/g.81063  ORF Transcript_45698/g.81063 Transcript_45698/m.81063 type:complete len:246 (-) Transcript_45698:631-1368(-)